MYISSLEDLDIFLEKTKLIGIYGAGEMGRLLSLYMEKKGLSCHISLYVMTDAPDLPSKFLDKVVIPNSKLKVYQDLPVLIATKESLHKEILQGIDSDRRAEVYCLTDRVWKMIKNSLIYQSISGEIAEGTIIEEILSSSGEKKGDILFISPPYWDVYSPFSAVPSLVAKLKQEKISAIQVDLGIESFHYLLEHTWRLVAASFESFSFYRNEVCGYEKNPYDSYEKYYSDLWFFHEADKFPLRKIKSKYSELNDIQRGVLNRFYQGILSLDRKDINFNVCKSIEEMIASCSWEIFYSVLLSERVKSVLSRMPNIVGIAVTSTAQFLFGCKLARLLKSIKPDVKIIFGGSCSDLFLESLYPNKIEIYQYFDYVICGEGETAVHELCQYLLGQDVDVAHIPNLAHIDEQNSVTFAAQILEDVENLPLADYRGLDLERYVAIRPILPYQASRGCHYGHCAFCDHNEKYRHNYRKKSKEKVVKEIVTLSQMYNVQDIQFVDEAIRPDHFIEIIGEMEENVEFHNVGWFYYSRVSREYTSEILQKAKRCGCRMVMFGIETFNQRLLNFVKKGITAEVSRYCLKLFHDNGIKTFAWLMCNLPSETLDELRGDMAEVERNVSYMDGGISGLFELVINTDMYREPEKYNVLSVDMEEPTRFVSHNGGKVLDYRETEHCFFTEYLPMMKKYFFYRDRYQIYFSLK